MSVAAARAEGVPADTEYEEQLAKRKNGVGSFFR
jgi:hypothetical protein